jgi:hypothetical protein
MTPNSAKCCLNELLLYFLDTARDGLR